MAFTDILAFAKIQAIRDKLLPNELSVFKSFCRAYSEKFHVPLPDALKMDPEEILEAVFASQLEDVDMEENIDSILEQIYAIEDPEYVTSKEEELKDFIKQAESDEEERIKNNKPIHRSMGKPRLNEEENTAKGGVDFSNLNSENEK